MLRKDVAVQCNIEINTKTSICRPHGDPVDNSSDSIATVSTISVSSDDIYEPIYKNIIHVALKSLQRKHILFMKVRCCHCLQNVLIVLWLHL